jgi:hypothetical protein
MFDGIAITSTQEGFSKPLKIEVFDSIREKVKLNPFNSQRVSMKDRS